MSFPTNTHRNRAFVLLHKAGISFYSIEKAFDYPNRRNIIRIWKRDKDKYFLDIDRYKQNKKVV